MNLYAKVYFLDQIDQDPSRTSCAPVWDISTPHCFPCSEFYCGFPNPGLSTGAAPQSSFVLD